MAWDDELAQLISQTLSGFGQDALDDAATRAVRAVMATTPPTRPIPSDGADVNTIFSQGVIDDALKVELRRLLQPH